MFGTTGNYQLLLDLKHDDRPVVNIGSEYVALAFRPPDEYKFTKNYVNESSNPKQLVLGVPSKTPTETKWKIKFGEAKTYTGDYAENTLIVGDALWAHLSREENDMRIIFKPSERGENRWKITVKKGKQRIHRATVEGANILAYQEGLVRSNLYNLVNGEKKRFNLKKSMEKYGRKKWMNSRMISLMKLIRADKLRCICHVKEIKEYFAIKNSIKHSKY